MALNKTPGDHRPPLAVIGGVNFIQASFPCNPFNPASRGLAPLCRAKKWVNGQLG